MSSMGRAGVSPAWRRPVAVVSFAQYPTCRREEHRNEVEILMPVVAEALDAVGLTKDDMGFVCSGSSDYLVGAPFSFVMALDAVGAWPPLRESHVEMDGAFALYEAWVMLQSEEIDTALVYSFGRSSPGDIRRALGLQLDPYTMAPLWPDSVSLAALQARVLIDRGIASEDDFAEVASRCLRNATSNPNAQVSGTASASDLMADAYVVEPLRRHACPPVGDGAAAVVLAAGERASELVERPAWITGMDHRVETHALGARDLADSPSTRLAAQAAGLVDGVASKIDLAELHAPFAHQELILAKALGLADGVALNPSGGALVANPLMVAGLARIGEAARRVMDGSAHTALAHATSGPCLQQNLVCLLSDQLGSGVLGGARTAGTAGTGGTAGAGGAGGTGGEES